MLQPQMTEDTYLIHFPGITFPCVPTARTQDRRIERWTFRLPAPDIRGGFFEVGAEIQFEGYTGTISAVYEDEDLFTVEIAQDDSSQA